jgi:hypothetical protein
MDTDLKNNESKYNKKDLQDLYKKHLEYKDLISSAPSILNKTGVVQYIKKLNNFRKKL